MKFEMQKSVCTSLVRCWRSNSIIRLVLAVSVILLLFSVPANASTDITVFGNQLWQDTGIDLISGQIISITATGSIHFKNGYTDALPDGWPEGTTPYFSVDSLLPSAHVLSLIGKVDDTALTEGITGYGSGFVGSSYEQIIPTSGRLWLAFNDSYSSDNSGSFTANVSSAVAPEPISSTLFLIGGATLGFRRFRKTITN